MSDSPITKNLTVSAPGKIILHGEHAVVYGKRAIALSVGLITKLSIKPITSNSVEIYFSEIGITTSVPLEKLREIKEKVGKDFSYAKLNESNEIPISEEIKHELEEFTTSHLGNCKDSQVPESLKPAQKSALQSFLFLYLAIFDEPQPFSLHIETEQPVGAGLGSSASFGVVLAGGILIASGRESESRYNVELINRWAFVSEKFLHGSPSGVDNSVVSFGGGVIFKKGEPLQHIANCPGLRVVLVNTKVSRSTKVLVTKVAGLQESNLELFTNSMNEIDDIVQKSITELQDSKCLNPDLIRRNQEILKTLGVSHPTLDTIVEIAQKHGFHGKLTGAGGGGCAFIAIPDKSTPESIEKLCTELEANNFQYWDTILGCKGFQVVA